MTIDLSHLQPVSDMMPEDIFWQIIAESLDKSNSEETQIEVLIENSFHAIEELQQLSIEQKQIDFLVEYLSKLSIQEIIGFELRLDNLLKKSSSSDLLCAAFIINGGCDEIEFEFFRSWIIAKGKETFYKAIENPDSLNDALPKDFDFYEIENEAFMFVAYNAFELLAGEDVALDEFIDYETYTAKEGDYEEINITWDDEKPETLRKICPNLFDRCWDNW